MVEIFGFTSGKSLSIIILLLFLSYTCYFIILNTDDISFIQLKKNLKLNKYAIIYLKSISAGALVPKIMERKLVQTTAIEGRDKSKIQGDVGLLYMIIRID